MKSIYSSIELFSGAGGLALGMSKAGFHHALLVESNLDAINTLKYNHEIGQTQIKKWNIIYSDIKNLVFNNYHNKINMVAGGPPCQPFSIAGKHQGKNDDRDMFPEAVRVIREIQPNGFVFENVKGLLTKSFSTYFKYIILQLSYPEITKKPKQKWLEHFSLLKRINTQGLYSGLKYNVVFKLLNAADYGVPQKRERVFIVGFRSDIDMKWDFPKPTHSKDSLLWQQWVTGEYWQKFDQHTLIKPSAPIGIKAKLLKKYGLFPPVEKPWVTLRESIFDLPNWEKSSISNHEFRDGAKAYPGHTGSPIDEPSKTLKAGNHGVPGGENMIRYNDGKVRYLTIREAARVQTFPDDYHFIGSWTKCMKQIGNAVPVKLAEVIASSVAGFL